MRYQHRKQDQKNSWSSLVLLLSDISIWGANTGKKNRSQRNSWSFLMLLLSDIVYEVSRLEARKYLRERVGALQCSCWDIRLWGVNNGNMRRSQRNSWSSIVLLLSRGVQGINTGSKKRSQRNSWSSLLLLMRQDVVSTRQSNSWSSLVLLLGH